MQVNRVDTTADSLRKLLENTAHLVEARGAPCEEVIRALKRNAGRHESREFFRDRGTKIVVAHRELEQLEKDEKAAPSPLWRKTREDIEAAFAAYDAAREADERPGQPAQTKPEPEPPRRPPRQAAKTKRRRAGRTHRRSTRK